MWTDTHYYRFPSQEALRALLIKKEGEAVYAPSTLVAKIKLDQVPLNKEDDTDFNALEVLAKKSGYEYDSLQFGSSDKGDFIELYKEGEFVGYGEPTYSPPQGCALDEIGMYGEQPGWLVNARWWGIEPEAWEAYRIADPSNPVRVFA